MVVPRAKAAERDARPAKVVVLNLVIHRKAKQRKIRQNDLHDVTLTLTGRIVIPS